MKLFLALTVFLAIPGLALSQSTLGDAGVSSTNGYFTGSVGIGGIASASAILHTLNGDIILDDSTNAARKFVFRRNSTSYGKLSTDNLRFQITSMSNRDLLLANTSETGVIIKDNTGNVGIGVLSPTERLDIGSGNISMGWETITNTCSGGAGIACAATCTSGKRVLGGGCDVITVGGGTIALQNATPNVNLYSCYFSGPYTSASVRAYAICANMR